MGPRFRGSKSIRPVRKRGGWEMRRIPTAWQPAERRLGDGDGRAARGARLQWRLEAARTGRRDAYATKSLMAFGVDG
jgi:hypothetical protein